MVELTKNGKYQAGDPYWRTYKCKTCDVTWKGMFYPRNTIPNKCWCCGKFGTYRF